MVEFTIGVPDVAVSAAREMMEISPSFTFTLDMVKYATVFDWDVR